MIVIPAIYEGSSDLKDKTKKLRFQTNEVTPEQAANLQSIVQQFCYLAIKEERFTKDELDLMTNLKADYEEFGKSHSQRQRAALYRLWEQKNEGYKDFNLFYYHKMDQFINHIKKQLV